MGAVSEDMKRGYFFGCVTDMLCHMHRRMKLFFCGDVVGRSGRDAVIRHLPKLQPELGIDFTVVNCDNASGGFGVSPKDARDLFAAGADVLTAGDHVWDQKDIIPYLEQERRLLRPANFPDGTPGFGGGLFTGRNGHKVFVLHLLGQVFHKENAECPFAKANQMLAGTKLGHGVQAILVDFHAEATSEKMAMGHHVKGRVSAVVGSHTHVPTNDARVLTGGTAYITDAGMCGDYDSVIGFKPESPLTRFLTKTNKARLEPAEGEGTLSGVLIDIDDKTGKAGSILPVQRGGALC